MTSDTTAGVLIVTGASRGIGAAIARIGARAGYAVCVNYANSRAPAEALVAEIGAVGGRAIAVQADVSKPAEVERLFATVDRAIVLEDDVHPHPSLFTWMDRMLDAYAERDDVAMLCGHNPLIRWPDVAPGAFAVPSRRGGVHGWGTWARAWWAVQGTDITGPVDTVDADVDACGLQPTLAALYRSYLSEARTRPLSWDVDWSLRMALSGRISIVPPVNLVHNLGLGPDATITKDGDDMLFRLPRPAGQAPSAQDHMLAPDTLRQLPAGADDRVFDRARVLIELLVRTRDPAMARRLARREDLPLDGGMRLHLLPFRHGGETRHWIEHLAGEGVDAAAIQRWRRALADDNDPPVAGMSQ